MNISDMQTQDIASIRQALGMANLQRSLNKDALSVSVLLEGMQEVSREVMEQSVNPHLGVNIDVSV